jgi:hypothetical protein
MLETGRLAAEAGTAGPGAPPLAVLLIITREQQ